MSSSNSNNGADNANHEVQPPPPAATQAVSSLCSICLEMVIDNGGRSIAKLLCGHGFHLDCIGSAFNMKGEMQCPNCRQVERGQWLFANGTPSEVALGLSNSEMPLIVYDGPFSGLMRVDSFVPDSGSPFIRYLELHAQLASVIRYYVAFSQPIEPVSSNSNETLDDPNFPHPWTGLSGSDEIYTPHVRASDPRYPYWVHNSPSFSENSNHTNGTSQVSISPTSLASSRAESDAIRAASMVHPFAYGHGSIAHTGSTVRPQDPCVRSAPAGMVFTHNQRVGRFSDPTGVPPPVIPAPLPDHGTGFYVYPPPSSSASWSGQELERPFLSTPVAQERDHPSQMPNRDAAREPFRLPSSSDQRL